MTPLNLARRPFRNERLQGLLVGIATVALLGLTVWHALVIRRLLPQRTTALHQEVRLLEKKLERFKAERKSARAPRPDARTLAQWTQVKQLVDQRMFSWTDLFASLEEVIPFGVRLVGIAPAITKDEVLITLTAMVRSPDDGWEFFRVLEDQPEFSRVYPTSEGEGGTFAYKMKYTSSAAWRQARAVAAAAAAEPSDGPAPEEAP